MKFTNIECPAFGELDNKLNQLIVLEKVQALLFGALDGSLEKVLDRVQDSFAINTSLHQKPIFHKFGWIS